ncbi:phosphoribosylaminoimidazolesuccinocarboxamide synthase [Actinoallomurus sp. CA-150999]|uniref:phosphoribosylaminoimidazolesuccinocarboxamide synthase n=1 Tax=Actinoallomurus sp. CA-150999 TaxID=3239887 RepID=UPI003D8A430B
MPSGFRYASSGKVRDIYELDADSRFLTHEERIDEEATLVLVATDRMSALDVVLGDEVPNKGFVLTALTQFWMDRLRDITPNHLVGWRGRDLPGEVAYYAGRAMLVKKLSMIPIECVVRGYLTGSAWSCYKTTGRINGTRLPGSFRHGDRLPKPIFTPAIKNRHGHDENVSIAQMRSAIGAELTEQIHRLSIELYERAAEFASTRGILIADTKFEFGTDRRGNLILADEVLTPDSSRFWLSETWKPGGIPYSFGRELIREWLQSRGWNGGAPPPRLPHAVVSETARRYTEICRILTGQSIDDWIATARDTDTAGSRRGA